MFVARPALLYDNFSFLSLCSNHIVYISREVRVVRSLTCTVPLIMQFQDSVSDIYSVYALCAGLILEAPEPAVVPLGSTASFTCRAVGDIFWAVDGLQVTDPANVESFAQRNISVGLSTPNVSIVIALATVRNNETTIECLVERMGEIAILNRTEIVNLTVYGKLRLDI